MPDDLGYEYDDDTTTYDGMDVDGDSELGGYEEPPSDTTTYDGMDVDGDDDVSGYEEPQASDTTTY